MSRARRRRRYRARRKLGRAAARIIAGLRLIAAPRWAWVPVPGTCETTVLPLLQFSPAWSLAMQEGLLDRIHPPTQGLQTPLTAPSTVALRAQAALLSRYYPRG